MPDYAIVIPVYNNEYTLAELTRRIDALFKNDIKKSYELVFIDDHSKDQSWQQLEHIKSLYPMTMVRLAENIGQHRATLLGFHYCQSDQIITIDGDLQIPPEEIVKLIQAKRDSIEIVIAKFSYQHLLWWRKFGTSFINFLLNRFFHKPKTLIISSFKLISKSKADELKSFVNQKGYLAAWILTQCQHNQIVNVKVQKEERRSGTSSYSVLKLLKMSALLVVHAFSENKQTKPYKITEAYKHYS